MHPIISLGTVASVESGDLAIKTSVCRPLTRQHWAGPYEENVYSPTLPYVPPLSYFLIRALFQYPEKVYLLDQFYLNYTAPKDETEFDILEAIVPACREDMATVDPRLWATLIQIYENLPVHFETYILPLSDQYMTLLQRIPATPRFTLITVLELPGCTDLTDTSLKQLACITTLSAFDASDTAISPLGVPILLRVGRVLRILSLRNCKKINDDIYASLPEFPLLSVVDLRGTSCRPQTSEYAPSSNLSLFHPSRLSDALVALQIIADQLYPSKRVYQLHIDALTHDPRRSGPQPSNDGAPSVVMLPKNSSNSKGPQGIIVQPNFEILVKRPKANLDESLSASTLKNFPIIDGPVPPRHVISNSPMSAIPVETPWGRIDVDEKQHRPLSFYAPRLIPHQYRRHFQGRGDRYCAADYYSHTPFPLNTPDSRLMLLRTPPRYDTLAAIHHSTNVAPRSVSTVRSSLDLVATVDTNNFIGVNRIAMLKQYAQTKPSVTALFVEAKDTALKQHSSVTSKNPFSKLRQVASTSTDSRIFKPISSIAVPVLPENELRALKRVVTNKQTPNKRARTKSTPTSVRDSLVGSHFVSHSSGNRDTKAGVSHETNQGGGPHSKVVFNWSQWSKKKP